MSATVSVPQTRHSLPRSRPGQAAERRARLVYFLSLFTSAAFANFFNVYLEDLGLSGSQIGVLSSTGAVAGLAGQILWGRWADRRGQPALALVQAALLTALLSLLLPAAAGAVGGRAAALFAVLLALSVPLRFGQFALNPLADALSMGVVDRSGRGSFGRIRLYGAVGFTVGGAVLGLILNRTSSHHFFYWAAVAAAAIAAVALRWPADEPSGGEGLAASPGARSAGPEAPSAANRAGLTRTLVFAFAAQLALSTGFLFLGLHMRTLGGGEAAVGLAYSAGSLAALPFYWAADRFERWVGVRGMFVLAAAAYLLRWVLTALAPSAPLAIAAQLLHGPGFALSYTGTVTTVYRLADRRGKSAALGLLAATGPLAQVAGGLLGGPLYDAGGGPAVFWAAGTLSAATLLYAWRALKSL